MPNIMMLETLASPEVILKKGKVYSAPNKLVEKLQKGPGGMIGALSADGRPTLVCPFEFYSEVKHGKRPIHRIPAKVDPEDNGDYTPEEAEIEYLED